MKSIKTSDVPTLRSPIWAALKAWQWVNNCLCHDDPNYCVDREQFKTIEDLEHWAKHLGEKTWITKEDIIVLVIRFRERHVNSL